jgi:hypothetical protein
MKTETLPPKTEAAVWFQILHPDGELPPATARALLRLSFPESERERMHALSAKAHADVLTPEEEIAMDNYERVGALLSTLKSKARQALKKLHSGS